MSEETPAMKRQHTPGPWVAHMLGGGKGGPNQYSIRVDRPDNESGEFAIATVAARMHQPARANAKLIAAAPDLLAACRFVLAQEDKGYTLSPEASDMLRTFIAKAEGREVPR